MQQTNGYSDVRWRPSCRLIGGSTLLLLIILLPLLGVHGTLFSQLSRLNSLYSSFFESSTNPETLHRNGYSGKPPGFSSQQCQPSKTEISEANYGAAHEAGFHRASERISDQLVAGMSQPSTSHRRHCGSNSELIPVLDKLLSLLPEEEDRLNLLRPIQHGDIRKRLRQLASKMRRLTPIFEAWKAVHIINDDNGQAYMRHDIIHFLRCSFARHPNLSSLISRYEALRSFLRRIEDLLFPWTSYYFPDPFSLYTHTYNGERGIVATAGDKQAPWLLTTIRMIRNLGCNLPIEIMYFGDSDLGSDLREELERLPGVIARNLKWLMNDSDWELKTFAGKPFATLMSSFSEVILIDADAVFLQNPEVLFKEQEYITYGALFFHDRILSIEDRRLRFSQPVIFRDQDSIARHGQRWLRQALPKPISERLKQNRMWTGKSRQVQESGVVVLDKSRHFFAMLAVTWINGPGRNGVGSRGQGFYDAFYGCLSSNRIIIEN